MYYDNISKGYNELHREEQLNKIRIISDNIDISENDSLLDVGSGTGFSFESFKCKKLGLDPSIELLKQSKDNVVCGVAENLPFKDNSFDIVVSVTALHNFEDVEKGLFEMKRVGKRFAFSVLKKSKKSELIKHLIENNFSVKKIIEEDKDLVFIIQ